LAWYLASAKGGLAQVQNIQRGATKIGEGLDDIRSVTVPFPPVEEQKEIAKRIEIFFKMADAIEKRVTAATAQAEKLTQAILAKAFRGELVSTEAELARLEGRLCEPASALLAKIEAQMKDVKPQRNRGRL
jgi:type I restriction enzyme S subunit